MSLKLKIRFISTVFIIVLLSFCSKNVIAQQISSNKSEEYIEIKKELEFLNKKIKEIEEENKSKMDKEDYTILISQKDIIYERVLDNISANAEAADSRTNYIIGALAIIGTLFALFGVSLNDKVIEVKKDAEKMKEDTEKIKEDAEKVKNISSQVHVANDEVASTAQKAEESLLEIEALKNTINSYILDIKTSKDIIKGYMASIGEEKITLENLIAKIGEMIELESESLSSEQAAQSKNNVKVKDIFNELAEKSKDPKMEVFEKGKAEQKEFLDRAKHDNSLFEEDDD